MLKYAKIVDEANGIVEVGMGNPDEIMSQDGENIVYVRDFYESIGMTIMDVEQAYNGVWYVAGKAPEAPETKEIRTFSKFYIWVATRNLFVGEDSTLTVWQAFETFLHDCQLWSGWNQLVDLVEDNPFFEQFYPIACEELGKELVDKVLAVSVVKTEKVII